MVSENTSTVIAIECFIRKDSSYLMLKRAQNKALMPGFWVGPGGQKELTEGLFECTRREVKEETNLEIDNIRIRATGVSYVEELDLELQLYHLTANYADGYLKGNKKDGNLAWFTVHEILELDNLLPELREILPHIFSDDPKVISYKAQYQNGNTMTFFEIET